MQINFKMLKKIFITFSVLTLFALSEADSQTYTGDIEVYINTFIDNMPGRDGNDYTIPGENELTIWADMLSDLLDDELTNARQKASQINYQIVEFADNSVTPNASYYVIEEKADRQHYWGTYIINRFPLRSQLVIQAPHPLYDFNTGKQGIFCFKRLGAQAFFISGTHRCNSDNASPCSGTTSACSASPASYRLSDNPHNLQSVFQKTTEIIYDKMSNTYFVQLHGFAKGAGDPYLIMSNGTRDTPDPDYIPVLKNELYRIDNTLTFKIAHIDISWSRLLAFTNVQGRYINNSIFPCSQNATQSSGRFIHLEQERERLRANIFGWLKMYEALGNTFPESSSYSEGLSVNQGDDIIIYTRPSLGLINIKASAPFTYSVYNLSGKCIYHASSTEELASIGTESLIPGLYLVKVRTNKSVGTQKVIIE